MVFDLVSSLELVVFVEWEGSPVEAPGHCRCCPKGYRHGSASRGRRDGLPMMSANAPAGWAVVQDLFPPGSSASDRMGQRAVTRRCATRPPHSRDYISKDLFVAHRPSEDVGEPCAS